MLPSQSFTTEGFVRANHHHHPYPHSHQHHHLGYDNRPQYHGYQTQPISPVRSQEYSAQGYLNAGYDQSPHTTVLQTLAQNSSGPNQAPPIVTEDMRDHLHAQIFQTREAITYGEADRKLVLEKSMRIAQRIQELEQDLEEWTKMPPPPPSPSGDDSHQQWVEITTAKREKIVTQTEMQQAMVNWWKKKGEEIEEWYGELAVPTPGYWEDEQRVSMELPEGT